jgi:hypothetical protein
MNDFLFFVLIGVSFVALFSFGLMNYNTLNQKIDAKFSSLNVRVGNGFSNLENGLNYLYASETRLTTSFEDRNGLYPSASYSNDLGTMIINTKNKSNLSVCKLFLHELGHKNCYPDLSEDCAIKYANENYYRCSEI